jgi:hypothetical protein
VPSLAQCDILVELHEKRVPGIADRLMDRFCPTHDIRVVRARPKVPDQYPCLRSVDENMRAYIISEERHGPQEWFYMTCKLPMDSRAN